MRLTQQIALARAPLYSFGAMGIMWGSYAALVPDIKTMLTVDDAAFGSLLLTTPLAAMAAMLAAPSLARLLGRRALPIATLAFAMTFALPGQFAVPAQFAAAMMLVGAATGFMDVLMNARVAALEASARTHLMNLSHGIYSLAYAAGAVVTGFARSAGAPPGQVLATAALAVALFCWITAERGSGVNGFARRDSAQPGLGMIPVWGGILVMIAFMAENAAENWSALHIERTLGGSPSQGSLGPALLALVMGLGRIFGQVVIARIDERTLLVTGSALAAVGLVIAGLAPTPWVVYAGLFIMGIGGSVIAPTAYAIIGRKAQPAARAHALARATVLGYMGYFFGPPALGLISQMFGLPMAFVAMAGVLVLAQGVIALLFRQPR